MKSLLSIIISLLACQSALSQSLSLDSLIEQNNPQLKLARKAAEVSLAEKKAQNSIGETSVEYTPFFQKGADGVATSELVVSQEFDFPTLYAARQKGIRLERDVMNRQYLVQRYETLLEAHRLYIDYIFTKDNGQFLAERLKVTDSLLVICDRRLRQGDATIMEQNRIRMDKMTLTAERRRNDAELSRLALELQRLGLPTDVEVISLDVLPLGENPLLRMPEALLAKARQEVSLAKQEWLPKLSVGYRRNTELHEYALNGVLVGMSVPLFSNAKSVKAARLREKVAEQEAENAQREVLMRRAALEAEARQLQAVLDAYDQSLMTQTLTTLLRAVTCGQISITEYYVEAERAYSIMQQRLETLRQYRKIKEEL